MGTDIHGVIQVKLMGRWKSVSLFPAFRDYSAFAALADIRNDGSITPISLPRGVPEDFELRDDGYYYGDAWMDMGDHSHSWVRFCELIRHIERYGAGDGILLKCLEYIMMDVSSIYRGADVRVVFGFDS